MRQHRLIALLALALLFTLTACGKTSGTAARDRAMAHSANSSLSAGSYQADEDGRVTDFRTQGQDPLTRAGQDVGDTLKDAARDAGDGVKDAARDVTEGAKNAVGDTESGTSQANKDDGSQTKDSGGQSAQADHQTGNGTTQGSTAGKS